MSAGLLGVTTAYYLSQNERYNVIVLDLCDGPAEETSFANAGLLSPSHACPRTNPRAVISFLKQLLIPVKDDNPIAYNSQVHWSWSFFKWGCSFMKQCFTGNLDEGTKAFYELACESRDLVFQVYNPLTHSVSVFLSFSLSSFLSLYLSVLLS